MAIWPYNTVRWRQIRLSVLRDRPKCAWCPARSLHVDHIRSIWNGGDPWARVNMQALCPSCHSRKTYREQRELPINLRTDRPKPLPKAKRGCYTDGTPKDPDSVWYKLYGS